MFITEISVPASIRRDFIVSLERGTELNVAIEIAALEFNKTHYMRYEQAVQHLTDYAVACGYSQAKQA